MYLPLRPSCEMNTKIHYQEYTNIPFFLIFGTKVQKCDKEEKLIFGPASKCSEQHLLAGRNIQHSSTIFDLFPLSSHGTCSLVVSFSTYNPFPTLGSSDDKRLHPWLCMLLRCQYYKLIQSY